MPTDVLRTFRAFVKDTTGITIPKAPRTKETPFKLSFNERPFEWELEIPDKFRIKYSIPEPFPFKEYRKK